MEIQEMLKIQRNCRKRAKQMAKRVYRTYDRIWVQRIRVTPELDEMGDGLVSRINGKMPNLLLRKGGNAPDIFETAAAYGFESGKALADYLAAYEPRKALEERIYRRLAEKAFSGLTFEEYEVACGTETAVLQAIVSKSKREAREYTELAYEKYDEVWYGRIRVTPELRKFATPETLAELNAKMPNLLCSAPEASAVDQVMMRYGFETVDELLDWLLAYEPRGPRQNSLMDDLAREYLGLPALASNSQPVIEPYEDFGTDAVPF